MFVYCGRYIWHDILSLQEKTGGNDMFAWIGKLLVGLVGVALIYGGGSLAIRAECGFSLRIVYLAVLVPFMLFMSRMGPFPAYHLVMWGLLVLAGMLLLIAVIKNGLRGFLAIAGELAAGLGFCLVVKNLVAVIVGIVAVFLIWARMDPDGFGKPTHIWEESPTGKTDEEILDEYFNDMWARHHQSSSSSSEDYSYNGRIYDESGNEVDLSSDGRYVRNSSGNWVGVTGSDGDYTDRDGNRYR